MAYILWSYPIPAAWILFGHKEGTFGEASTKLMMIVDKAIDPGAPSMALRYGRTLPVHGASTFSPATRPWRERRSFVQTPPPLPRK